MNNIVKPLHEYDLSEHDKFAQQLAVFFREYRPIDHFHHSVFVTYIMPVKWAYEFAKEMYELRMISEDFSRFIDLDDMFTICEILPKLCAVTIYRPHFEGNWSVKAGTILLSKCCFSLTTNISMEIYNYRFDLLGEQAQNVSRRILDYIVQKILNVEET